jgi:uncharacterized protein (TIGR02145 family)
MKIFLQHLAVPAALCLLGMLIAPRLSAQKVIAGATPDPSALLDVQSAAGGVLLPRMTTAEREAIANPATGLLIFNTTLNCMEVNVGTPARPAWGCVGVIFNSVTAASSTPIVCNNASLPPITHTTTGATGIGAATGLPPGVSAAWAENTITISGTPTSAGVFNYSIPLTGGSGGGTATGTITVTAVNTAGAASSTPTLCVNTDLTAITHTTTRATGIGAATGLPGGVTASWASNMITISGTPTASGTFNYTIPLTGGCGSAQASGTITVNPVNTAGAASSTPTLCVNTALTAITHTTTRATGISAATGLPGGVTASWASNTITISGTPMASGTFNYTIPLTGGCGSAQASGTIMVPSTLTGCQVCGVGRVLTFSCYNLGAAATTDPYTPRWELNGHYYQWGRAAVAANGPSGSGSTQANAGTITDWNTTAAPNGAWADGSKTANDPCPAGFRVPTSAQWVTVLNTSLNPTRSYPGTWSSSSTNYSAGLRIGAGTTGLFLPAAGYRYGSNGTLYYRGTYGYYWSSTEDGIIASILGFSNGNADRGGFGRTNGVSIRCVAE